MTTDAALDLLVQPATWEARGVLGLDLVHPDGEQLPPWQPGAHVDLALPSGTIRQYSLCGDPADRTRYRIGILRQENGRGGSLEAHTTALVGSLLRVNGPRNRFPLVPAARYLFIAGGIGITPILAMLREVTAPWSLVYGGRSLASMAYRDEIATLAGGQVTLVPQDTNGLPDLDGIIATAAPDTAVYCCGAEGLLREVERLCAANLPPGALHVERHLRNPRTGRYTIAPRHGPQRRRTRDRRYHDDLRQQVENTPADTRSLTPGFPFDRRAAVRPAWSLRGVADLLTPILLPVPVG